MIEGEFPDFGSIESKPLTHVYVAIFGDFVKIGAARDVERRLDDLARSGFGLKRPPSTRYLRPTLAAYYRTPDARGLERALHDAFDEQREIGEWFRIEGRMARWLEKRKPYPQLYNEPDGVDLTKVVF